MNSFVSKIKSLFAAFARTSLLKKVVIIAIFLGAAWMIYGNLLKPKQAQNYTTAQAEKGTLVVSVAESGTVAIANRVSISTQTSGTVNNVYVKNGDSVTAGEKIADLTLDSNGLTQQAQAYTNLASAQSQLAADQANLNNLQATMFSDWQTYMNLATNSTYQNPDGSANNSNRVLTPFTIAQDNWLGAQADYQNQQLVLAKDQAALSAASRQYNAVSSSITAPSDGTISDITIAPGMVIANSQSASNSSISSQVVASIKHAGNPIISVSLSEIDATKVKANDRATISFDALPDKTFTGKVLGIDTTGTVSQGVTSYPATIALDSQNDSILPNMSATANIIINVKDNVLLVPSAAVTTRGTQSIVYAQKNGQITPVNVTIGDSDGSNTEITSGISEGDTVLVGYSPNPTATSGSTGTSPFSRSIFGGGAGGNRVFINSGGGGARGGAGR